MPKATKSVSRYELKYTIESFKYESTRDLYRRQLMLKQNGRKNDVDVNEVVTGKSSLIEKYVLQIKLLDIAMK